ncbi:discoidin domain-containing protein [Dactylosporangium sucinum]|uniref:F5/8 type C domain-containing protein n=1 Tax=Dactylosporangium sucinum TaxID=1424081 RepID=A0A917UCZ1_9ACTN|nr:discoidin domain-containing protein [Dactylosporangium sucinum]GGM79273.1 hypothetical protein GCM10007977_095990 [Dactylosporangium sucinum]
MEVLIGGVAVPDGWLALAVPPQAAPTAADLVEPVRAAVRTGTEGVLLLVPGDVAAGLAGPLGLPVVAPAGPVVASPSGTLFADAGFWRHTPDGRRVAEGPRWPAPAWQSAVPARTPWPSGAEVRAVPAGWALGPVPSGPAPGPAAPESALAAGASGSALGSFAAAPGSVDADLALAVAVDPDRPRLLFDPALGPEPVAAALLALPPTVRAVTDLVPLGPGQGAGRAVAAGAAARCGEPVQLVNGVPLHTPGGQIIVCCLDATHRPVWPEPAWLVRVLPDGTEEVLASSPPQPTLRPIDAATYATDQGWTVRLTGGGLHAQPPGAAPPDPAPVDGRYRVVVGVAGAPVDDLLWPPLSALFTAALTDIPAAVELAVAGEASAWGLAAARELAGRHPGHPPAATGTSTPAAGAATGPSTDPNGSPDTDPDIEQEPSARPFLAAVAVAMPREPEVLPAGVGRAGRRRLSMLVAAAIAVVVLAVAGVAAAWPDRDSGSGDAAGVVAAESADGGPQTAGAPGSSAAGSPSGRPSSARPSASGSPSPQRSASASAGPSASPPEVLDGGPDLAAGRAATESSHTDVYPARNVTDGDPMTYWESRNNAFPQWVQVDLGSATDVGRVVFRLPPSTAWPARTQRIAVLGSRDGSSFSTLSGDATYSFAPSAGNRAVVTFGRSQQRYVRLVFTANSGQPAGQLSVVEVYRA